MNDLKAIVLIPTYNEKGNIEKLIRTLEAEIFPKIKSYRMEIMVIDDSSPDGTGELIGKLKKKYKNLYLFKNGKKLGLGAAYIKGMTEAVRKYNPDVIIQMDADLSHDPRKIPEFLKKIDQGYDLVTGSRYVKGGSIPSNWGIHRKFFSISGNLTVRAILMRFNHHDWTSGYRAMRSNVFEELRSELIEFKGYTFLVSFLHKAISRGFKVTEIPISFTDRVIGKSKIAPREYVFDLLRYVINSKFKEIIH